MASDNEGQPSNQRNTASATLYLRAIENYQPHWDSYEDYGYSLPAEIDDFDEVDPDGVGVGQEYVLDAAVDKNLEELEDSGEDGANAYNDTICYVITGMSNDVTSLNFQKFKF